MSSQARINLDAEDYAAAARLIKANLLASVRNADIRPNWFDAAGRFWYQKQTSGGSQFVVVDAQTGSAELAFDHVALAAALNEVLAPDTPLTAENLGLQNPYLTPDGRTLSGSVDAKKVVTVNLENYSVETVDTKAIQHGPVAVADRHPWRQARRRRSRVG